MTVHRRFLLIPLQAWVGVSLALHLASYWGSEGILPVPGSQRARASHGRSSVGTTVELEFEPLSPPDPTQAASEDPAMPVQLPSLARPAPTQPLPSASQARAPSMPPPPPPTHPAPDIVRAPTGQMVEQTVADGELRPDNARFLAEQNHDVAEETQAQARDRTHDDPHPRLGGAPSLSQALPSAPPQPSAAPATATLPARTPPRSSSPAQNNAQASTARQGARGNPGPSGATGRRGTPGAPGARVAPGATASAAHTLTGDGPPAAPGPSVQGGGAEARAGDPLPSSGDQGQGGSRGGGGSNGLWGQRGQDGTAQRLGVQGLGVAGTLAALGPDSAMMERLYGREALDRLRQTERDRRIEARNPFAQDWQTTRTAIENFIPQVRVGSTTALRTAASPFARYLTAMHRRIHEHFAEGFIPRLAALPDDNALNNRALLTRLEIILEPDGSVHRIGIVRTSGILTFDVAAMQAVRVANPYGEVPAGIRSVDGRLYTHWDFHRDERWCGPAGAQPYIVNRMPSDGSRPTPPPPTPPPPREGGGRRRGP
ncbi:MAG: TonB C-terminal domain-containing protein [Deltaproteobacteria bacterium]|nr:TonB C-terminal domain-containing protein [Deltaproteobacteria bacterium]